MPKPFLPTAALLLVVLAAMMACTGASPDPTETPSPSPVAAMSLLIANTPTPEATEGKLQ